MDINTLYPRHFLTTAKEVNFPQDQMQEILRFFAENIPSALETAQARLPHDFSPAVYRSVATHTLKLHARLMASL